MDNNINEAVKKCFHRCFFVTPNSEKKNLEQTLQGFYNGSFRHYFPYAIFWKITSDCNLRCKHCYYYHSQEKFDCSKDLSIDELLQLAKFFVEEINIIAITITGGEPFLKPGILELINYLKSKNVSIQIQTNATLINKDLAARLKQILNPKTDIIQVSLDGVTEEVHDKIRGKGNFQKAIAGIKNLTDNHINVSVSYTITSTNAKELPDLYELAKDLRIRLISLNRFRICNSEQSYLEPDSDEIFVNTAKLLDKFKEKEDLYLKLSNIQKYDFLNYEAGKQLLDQLLTSKKTAVPDDLMCHRHGKICINARGEVYLCSNSEKDELCLGNLKEKSFYEIWENRFSNVFFNPRCIKDNICRRCKYVGLCEGGCPARAYCEYGTINAPDSNCAYGKELMNGVNYIPFSELMQKILGIPSKEDNEIIAQKTKILSETHDLATREDLLNLCKKKTMKFFKLLEDNGINSKQTEQGLKYTDISAMLDKKTRNKIKEIYTEVLSANEYFISKNPEDILVSNPSLNDWFKNAKYSNKFPNFFHSLFVHPADKTKLIIGDFTPDEQEIINKEIIVLKKKNLPLQKLLSEKENIIQHINSVLNTSKLIKQGELTAAQLKKLKKSILKYEIYNKILIDNKIMSKTIESVIYNCDKNLSDVNIGDYICDIGLLVQKTTIYDKTKKSDIPCFIVFNKDEFGNSLKLIKIQENYEKTVSGLKQEYEKIKKCINSKEANKLTNEINYLERKARDFIDRENDNNIAKIRFYVAPAENIKDFWKDINELEKVINLIETLQKKDRKTDKIAYIIDFINFDASNYFEGGRKLALALIHLLKEHNFDNILITANAIGESTKSPVRLYLRAGFEPLFPSMDEIIKLTNNFKKHLDPKMQVYMYLPEDAMVNEVVEKQKPLQEIFN